MNKDQSKKPNIHEGHRKRLREEYKTAGTKAMADHKLLELYLFPFIPRKDTNPIAHALLDTFGSLENILHAHYSELYKVKGMTETAAIALSLIRDITTRVNISAAAVAKITNFAEAYNICVSEIAGCKKEEVLLICLDNGGKILKKAILTQGDVTKAAISPRKITEEAIRVNAVKVLLSHNHPSGIAEPSREDLEFTKNIAIALAYQDIMLIDHIIVTPQKEAFSLKREGFISQAIKNNAHELPGRVVAEIDKETQW